VSYEVASGATSSLTRTTGTLGVTSCFWVKNLEFVHGGDPTLYVVGNGEDWVHAVGNGSFGGVITSTYGVVQNNTISAINTGSNTSWTFVCMIGISGVGATFYYRHEGDPVLQSFTVADSGVSNVNNFLLLGSGAPANNKRVTAYKEWQNMTDLTVAQIFAESTQKAPIYTTNLTNYLSMDVGSTIGHDQSAAAQNWTVSGTTVTTASDEPNMAVSTAYVRQFIQSEVGSSTTITGSITPLAGSTVFVGAIMSNQSNPVTCTGSVNGSYTSTGSATASNAHSLYGFYKLAASSNTDNITVNLTIGPGDLAMCMMELVNVSAFSTTHGNHQTGTGTGSDVATSGNMTPTGQPALLLGTILDDSDSAIDGVLEPGTGFVNCGTWWTSGGFPFFNARNESKRLTSVSPVAATFNVFTGSLDMNTTGFVFLETSKAVTPYSFRIAPNTRLCV